MNPSINEIDSAVVKYEQLLIYLKKKNHHTHWTINHERMKVI